MLGIIIAVLWWVFAVVVGGNPLEPVLLNIAGFLWYWYLSWGIFAEICCVGLSLCSLAAGEGLLKAAGFFSGVVLAILCAISTTLYLTASYLVIHAGDAMTPITEWDTTHLVAAGVCAGTAVVFQIMSKPSSSK